MKLEQLMAFWRYEKELTSSYKKVALYEHVFDKLLAIAMEAKRLRAEAYSKDTRTRMDDLLEELEGDRATGETDRSSRDDDGEERQRHEVKKVRINRVHQA